jgi:glyoxylase-like metal-dependent hydrolase (beta-lactamase superfamily II)
VSNQAWTADGPENVAPGVHRIPLPLPSDGLRAVNVYAIESGDGLVLIDSGWALAEARAELAQALKSLGHGLADVRSFLVTHVHRDHYTQAVVLRREFGSRICLGADERASLRLAAEPGVAPFAPQLRVLHQAGAGGLARQIAGIADDGAGESSLWADPDEWVTGGSTLAAGDRALEVIATPGHTFGHVVFRDAAAGLLFAGDHVLPHITPSIGFEPAPGPLPLADYLESLRRVRAVPDTRLLPAHGPVTGSVHARVDELLAHHATRLAQTADAVRRGASTGLDVAQALRWTRRERALGDFDVFNQMLAINETVAHLDVLVATGELTVVTDSTVAADGPVRRYQLRPGTSSGRATDPAR